MSLFKNIDREIIEIKVKHREKAYKKIQDLKNKSELYRPSNGTEGMIFESNICGSCKRDNSEKNKICRYLGKLQAEGQCEEIIQYKGEIMCVKHTNFDIDKVEL